MSLRKNILIAVSAGITILGFLSCSNLNDSTDVGNDILTNSDPSLTSFDKNFLAFSGDSNQVLQYCSIPGSSSDPLFGIHNGMITLGNKGMESSTGYVKFLIDDTLETKFNPGDSLLSITIQFDTLVRDSEHYDPGNIRIQSCLNDSASVRTIPDQSAIFSDTLQRQVIGSDTILVDTISGKIKDSIFSACTSYVNRITKCGKDTSCTRIQKIPLPIAFSLFNGNHTGLCRLQKPAMTIRYTRKNNNKTDTLSQTKKPYYFNFIAYESQEAIDSLSALPLSSYAAERVAVFKINLQPLWNKIDSSKQANFNEILSACFIIKGKNLFSDSITKFDSTIEYGYFFSPQLIKDGYYLHDSLFARGRTGTSTNGDSILMPVEYLLRPIIRSDRPAFGYLYIGISSSYDLWKRVLWGKPLFKAVVTTLKR